MVIPRAYEQPFGLLDGFYMWCLPTAAFKWHFIFFLNEFSFIWEDLGNKLSPPDGKKGPLPPAPAGTGRGVGSRGAHGRGGKRLRDEAAVSSGTQTPHSGAGRRRALPYHAAAGLSPQPGGRNGEAEGRTVSHSRSVRWG